MISQSVLLRGVNDDPDTLADLMRAFVEARVKPYYLHHPDLAPGTAHFRVSVEAGRDLMAACVESCRDCASRPTSSTSRGHGKAVIGPDAIEPRGEGCYAVTDFRGQTHAYPPTDVPRPRHPVRGISRTRPSGVPA